MKDRLDTRAYKDIVRAGHEMLKAVSEGVWKEDWPPSLKTATLLALSYAIALVAKRMSVTFNEWSDYGLCSHYYATSACVGCPGNFKDRDGHQRCGYWQEEDGIKTLRHDLERALAKMVPENRNMVLGGKAIRTVYAHVIE